MEVPCEKVEDVNYRAGNIGLQSVCYLAGTMINTPGFTIASERNESIGGLYMLGNRVAFNLLIRVNEKFPGLVVYMVTECTVKTINKGHFDDMRNLKQLDLVKNQIKSIDGTVFEDLTALQFLYLSKKFFSLN